MPPFKQLVLLFSRVFGVAGYGALVGPTWLAPLAVAVISCTLNPTVREFGQITAGCVVGIAISVALHGPFAYSMGVGFVGAALVGLTASAIIDLPAQPAAELQDGDCASSRWPDDTATVPELTTKPTLSSHLVF
jgi:hypothetical protein